ncbi:uncharacterized protein B0I36DRAFT_133136 [Microdochium trichocladiopsis]|uniref:C2H2-type domain-containing protein n=1 Tax=Microdochium trichocladiopsis TaxID=1682393 RepID=A0A9P8Y6W0_9PEZI|nr:uncharacterized protein B0I36DRAFT_133136 [Microdochium trichocladiopsis]KAH7029473.1 hypothetical protein B0I36DRAFT_133136 [Microdochium trichocladiopsis]
MVAASNDLTALDKEPVLLQHMQFEGILVGQNVAINSASSPPRSNSRSTAAAAPPAAPPTRKRKAGSSLAQATTHCERSATSEAPERRVCVTCSKAYESANNHDRACLSHGGFQILNDNDRYWDLPSRTRDEQETHREEVRLCHPKGFTWVYCGRDGTSPGCRRRPHQGRRKL